MTLTPGSSAAAASTATAAPTATSAPSGTAVTSHPALRLGTRRSTLALTQSALVAERLRALGREVEIVEIVTEGDVSTAPLETIGGTGVFASAIRHALLAGEVDLAVHSLKDLPTVPEPGLVVAAVPLREDPRDVLVARDGLTLGELPEGASIGTGSPRRVAQLTALGLGVAPVGIRGNVETRLGKVERGEVDAVVLARAGLSRLGRLDQVTETLDPLQMLPAPGQGALAVECRADDTALIEVLFALEDADTRAAVTAERALLAELEAGCSAPIGALGEVVEGMDGLELSLRAFAGSTDGAIELRRSIVGPVEDAADLGAALARVLLEDGADAITPDGVAPLRGDHETESRDREAENRDHRDHDPDGTTPEPARAGAPPGPPAAAYRPKTDPLKTTERAQ